jgi:hypothetical protein
MEITVEDERKEKKMFPFFDIQSKMMHVFEFIFRSPIKENLSYIDDTVLLRKSFSVIYWLIKRLNKSFEIYSSQNKAKIKKYN